MKTCPYCQSTSFADSEVCYGCLYRFEATSIEMPVVIEPTGAPAGMVDNSIEVSKAITLGTTSKPGFTGMARLHVKMPQGYHYDVYLEKPEGASIQIGWVADIPSADALVVPAAIIGD